MNELRCCYFKDRIDNNYCVKCSMDLDINKNFYLMNVSLEKLVEFNAENNKRNQNNFEIPDFDNMIEEDIFFMQKAIFIIEEILKMNESDLNNLKICSGNIFCFKLIQVNFHRKVKELTFKKIYS